MTSQNMQDMPFELPFGETESAEVTYAIAGRALCFVAEFEASFRSFNMLLRILDGLNTGQVELDDEESVKRLFEALLRTQLATHIKEIVDKLRLAAEETREWRGEHISLTDAVDYLADLFHRARKARNEIVHKFPLGLWLEADTEKGRQRVLQDVSFALIPLSEAPKALLLIMAATTGQPVPNTPHLRDYSLEGGKWVCGDLDFLNARAT